MIEAIAAHPANMRAAVAELNDEQLDTPYREDGWTVRQVVHHVVDSHLNSYQRFKLALTEDKPTIRTYDQAAWAELPEAKAAPVEVSLALLEALHVRWVMMLRGMEGSDFEKLLDHPGWGTSAQTSYSRSTDGTARITRGTSLRCGIGWAGSGSLGEQICGPPIELASRIFCFRTCYRCDVSICGSKMIALIVVAPMFSTVCVHDS